MITLDKWYPMVQPRHDMQAIAFDKAVERVQMEYDQALKANKIEKATLEMAVELYDKRARQHTIELGMFENRKRFEIFV